MAGVISTGSAPRALAAGVGKTPAPKRSTWTKKAAAKREQSGYPGPKLGKQKRPQGA